MEVALKIINSDLKRVRADLNENNVWSGGHLNINLSGRLYDDNLALFSFMSSVLCNFLGFFYNLFNLILGLVECIFCLLFFLFDIIYIKEFPLRLHPEVSYRSFH